MDLESDQNKANEKFITAQLLSSSLNRVYQIFIQNLTFNNKGKSEKNDSIDFLNYLQNRSLHFQKPNLVFRIEIQRNN